MKLIDADALKKSVNDKSTHWLNDWSTIGVLAEVDRQPTIDAVPVVRCKDCIYLGHVHDFMGLEIESFQCGRTNTEVKLDDFCSYVEREDE